VLWDVESARAVEEHVARRRLHFPYVPGLLSFREAPVLLTVLRRLRQRPDLLMCDGHGRAHPRRFGLACHLGILTGFSSLGCAKSLLVGEHAPLPNPRGSSAALMHAGEQVGVAVRTRGSVRPVFVSVGHRISLEEAVHWVLACGRGYRLPEPMRRADRLVGLARVR
jgi:deoxyribonuclease V